MFQRSNLFPCSSVGTHTVHVTKLEHGNEKEILVMLDKISIFRTTPRIVMGPGAVNGLGREVQNLEADRALIVTDPGILDAGILGPVEDIS